jgi:hypothetical protein
VNASFRVYRGSNPSHLFWIASDQAPAAEFTDPGLEKQLATAPDENYDHANFYWRFELLPEIAATIHSAETIGNGTLQMAENEYRGMVARITRTAPGRDGHGIEQRRAGLCQSGASSRMRRAICHRRGRLACGRTTRQARSGSVPGRGDGPCVGRSANVTKECAYELSPLTVADQARSIPPDADVPGCRCSAFTRRGGER